MLTSHTPNLGSSIFQDVPNGRSDENQFTIKYDHNFNQNHQLNAYHYFNDGTPTARSHTSNLSARTFFLASAPRRLRRSQQMNFSHIWTINPQDGE